jgi:hypothetical protein
MKRIVTVLALLIASAPSAFAGRDWDDDDYYEYEARPGRGEYRAYYGVPAYRVPSYGYYIPYGTYFAEEPDVYGPNCTIERKWRNGRYKEKIECDDDD